MRMASREVRSASVLPNVLKPARTNLANEELIEKSAQGVLHARSDERNATRPSQNVKGVALLGEYVTDIPHSTLQDLQLLNRSTGSLQIHLRPIPAAILA